MRDRDSWKSSQIRMHVCLQGGFVFVSVAGPLVLLFSVWDFFVFSSGIKTWPLALSWRITGEGACVVVCPFFALGGRACL